MPRSTALRLGTRASALARWQADWVAGELARLGVAVEIVTITTSGDEKKTQPIGQIGGQGLFTKEIQRALLEEEIDLAVHSLKDLPTVPVDGLAVTAVPKRASAADVLVSKRFASIEGLPEGSRVGTGSMRRRSQLLHHRPDLKIEDIRGNVDTRLKKLADGHYDAIVLAEAGLRRLGWERHIAQILEPARMMPAVGQGALGIEVRSADQATRTALEPLDDASAHAEVLAERSLLAALCAGCLAPVGALGRAADKQLVLQAVVLSSDGQERLQASASGSIDEAESIGQRAAAELLDDGADRLIRAAHA